MPDEKRSRAAFISLLLLLHLACATKTIAPGSQRGSSAVLRTQLERVFADPRFNNAFWGVAVQSMETGEIIYEQNADKLLMPASNMKILTAVASLKKLGADFRYETAIKTDGKILNGTLQGNLVIIGSGDPTISARFSDGDHFRIFNEWSAVLKQRGIERIAGNIIGVDDAFDDERLGFGWSWDDLPYYYATESGALQFAENAITITLLAGQPFQPVEVRKEPVTSYVRVIPEIAVQAGAQVSVQWTYKPERLTVHASGTLPSGGQDYGSFSISNPAAYFAHVLKETLERNGITVDGESYRAADHNYQIPDFAQELLIHRSPPLSEIVSVLLKVSNNLFGETLLKTFGKGRSDAGIKEIESVLIEMGIEPYNYILKDGSGLSRYNYVTPRALLRVLQSMHRDAQFKTFYDALPLAGVEGTLKSRLKGSAAENNLRAKTGSISNVRSLSGYIRTADGEMLAFVIIANNFSVDDAITTQAQNTAVELLANFSRKSAKST